MTPPARPLVERRLQAAIEASPSRIPVLLGGCGTGRTSVLLRLRDTLGASSAQYFDLEAVATTPERCVDAIAGASPFPPAVNGQTPADAREAFDQLLQHVDGSRAPGHEPATFLIDEFLEFRTFENFPGLRHVIRDFITRIAASRNRFVLTSRYTARTLRVLRDAPARFEVIHLSPMGAPEVHASCGDSSSRWREQEDLAASIQALADGRATHASALAQAVSPSNGGGRLDPISALVALMAPGGAIASRCRQCYELRLHRARGYGALKAILGVLAEEEGLTLTEISQRLRRTPGSTKDYLSWLEDVDLVRSTRKRYAFEDPMLRLFVRLYGRPTPPTDEDVAREVHDYALARLPQTPPAPQERPREMAAVGAGIIEID